MKTFGYRVIGAVNLARCAGAALLLLSGAAMAMPQEAGTNWFTKPFWSVKKTYRFEFPIDTIRVADPAKSCTDAIPSPKLSAGKDSIFVEHHRSNDNKEIIGKFSHVSKQGVSNADSSPVLETAYRLCIKDTEIPEWKLRRAGGVDTGVLVIPFKVRSGSLYSDTAVGPYIAFSGSQISLLTTFGLTQVSTKPRGSDDIKEETGLTFAVGTIWRVKPDWDIGLVAGVDRLSGTAGRDFPFQKKWWWSFSIGYNFTQ